MSAEQYSYPGYAKLVHMGLAAFGVAAWLTGEQADDGTGSTGYLLHAYLGLSVGVFILLRLLAGLGSGGSLSFAGWSPFSRRQWSLALQDVHGLVQFRLPHRESHQGLSGLVQVFGLSLFALMAGTGTGLFVLGGGPETDVFEMLEELHEVGEALIPLYLAMHVGAVVLHTLAGDPVWKRMFGSTKP